MQRRFVLKDKLNSTKKNCTVSMATFKMIFKDGGVHSQVSSVFVVWILMGS